VLAERNKEKFLPFLSNTQPAKPSSMSQRYTLAMPPSKYLCRGGYQRVHLKSMQDGDSQLSIDVECLIGLDLHLAHALAGRDALVNRRLKLVAPRAAPTVAVAVVVAAQEVALRLGALLHRERNVDGFEQVFFERGVQRDNGGDIALDVRGVEAPQEVPGGSSMGYQQSIWQRTLLDSWQCNEWRMEAQCREELTEHCRWGPPFCCAVGGRFRGCWTGVVGRGVVWRRVGRSPPSPRTPRTWGGGACAASQGASSRPFRVSRRQPHDSDWGRAVATGVVFWTAG